MRILFIYIKSLVWDQEEKKQIHYLNLVIDLCISQSLIATDRLGQIPLFSGFPAHACDT